MRAHVDATPDIPELDYSKVRACIYSRYSLSFLQLQVYMLLSTCISFYFQFRNSKLDAELPDQPRDADAAGEFVEALEQSVTSLRRWAERVPGFGDLNREDQTLLFQSAVFELASLRMALR